MNDREKCLFVTSSLDSGGAERWVYNTLRAREEFRTLDIDCYYFRGVNDDFLLEGYHALGVTTAFRHLDRFGRLGEVVALYGDLVRFIEANGPYRAVHVNGTTLLHQAVAMLASERCGARVRIVHNHSSTMSEFGCFKSFLRNRLRTFILRHATMVASCSDAAAQAKYGDEVLTSPKYRLLRNGIDLHRFWYSDERRRHIRSELGIRDDEPLLLHIGRMEAEKNHVFLLECFAEFYKASPDARLVLIGTGSLHEAVMRKIADLDLANSVTAIDRTDEPELYYCAADCFVLPSRNEGRSFVSIEALACGCPIVLSDSVPTESWHTSLERRLSLDSGAGEWADGIAEEIAVGKATGRSQCTDFISGYGYSLNDTAWEFFRCLQEG